MGKEWFVVPVQPAMMCFTKAVGGKNKNNNQYSVKCIFSLYYSEPSRHPNSKKLLDERTLPSRGKENYLILIRDQIFCSHHHFYCVDMKCDVISLLMTDVELIYILLDTLSLNETAEQQVMEV